MRVQTVRFQDDTKEISTSINLEAMDMSLREQAPAKLAKNKTRGHMTIRWIAQSRTRTEIKQRLVDKT